MTGRLPDQMSQGWRGMDVQEQGLSYVPSQVHLSPDPLSEHIPVK